MNPATATGSVSLITQLGRVIYRRATEDVIGMRLKQLIALDHLRANDSCLQQGLGQMLMLIFSMHLGLFPAQGMFSLRYELTPTEKVFDIAHHLVLPALTLAFFNLALIARLTRSNMLQVLRLEYIIFARSKGLS